MQYIDVIFGRSYLPISLLIRLVTWSRWSHCGVIDGDHVIESKMIDGVIITKLEDFKKRYSTYQIVKVPVKDTTEDALLRAYNLVGDKYDYMSLIGVLFRTGWSQGGKWSCSEALAHICRMFRQDNVSRITPEDIWRISE